MNRYAISTLALVLVSAGGIYLAAHSPAKKSVPPAETSIRKQESDPAPAPLIVAEQTPPSVSAPTAPDPLLQAPDASKPLPKASPAMMRPPLPKEGASPYAKIVIPEGQPIPDLFPYQTERDEISQLAATYDAKKIPAIAAFLGHKDASVREAARLGLIQLGEEKAVPVLKEAAKKAPTPEEAALLTEAAEFLALPSFVEIVLPKPNASKS